MLTIFLKEITDFLSITDSLFFCGDLNKLVWPRIGHIWPCIAFPLHFFIIIITKSLSFQTVWYAKNFGVTENWNFLLSNVTNRFSTKKYKWKWVSGWTETKISIKRIVSNRFHLLTILSLVRAILQPIDYPRKNTWHWTDFLQYIISHLKIKIQ